MDSALTAMKRRNYVLTPWPWRSLLYLLSTPVAALLAWPLAVPLLPAVMLIMALTGNSTVEIGTAIVVTGLSVAFYAAGAPLLALPLAALERYRLRLIRPEPVRGGHRMPPRTGPWSWLVTRYTEAATWRAVVYGTLLAAAVPVFYLAAFLYAALALTLVVAPLVVSPASPMQLVFVEVTTPAQALPATLIGLLLVTPLPYLCGLTAGLHGLIATALLNEPVSGARLHTELVEVTRSRARLVDGFEAERRRIERDLHDGAQQRLVGLTLQLGLAKLDVPDDSPAAASVARAHEEAKALMAELRDLIAGIHPQVLTDLGLPAALRELADRTALSVTVHSDLGERPAAHLESTAYFVVAEALTNAVRHGHAGQAWVRAYREQGQLIVEVTDDGRGGASPDLGTGLTGLADRAAVTGGRMLLSSPPGGPTVVRVELPWIRASQPEVAS
ncbi:signal transduction histidine kinase [Catenuloplanes nepalensis]|uniref:histidine kinase n=1 Tax=Catenuloplanes nepalensis TaxID=587533 RepID=A0ABT9MVW2_9ACTN|nr:sensor domain-containing protein [Catenuloplanes nepalensis]MDP9795581.1 signal transduction histidine kinase [Catenuloplanes nepalensis]